MKNILSLGSALLLVVLLAAACTPIGQPKSSSPFEITSMFASLGGENNDVNTGIYSYTIVLTNRSGQPMNVQSVAPEVQKAFSSRLLTADLAHTVGHVVPAGESIEINGQLRFDFNGLSKQQIVDLGEPISGFDVTSQIYVRVPAAK